MTASAELTPHQQVTRARWALMAGNFAIGCGVMVVAGSLNDLIRSLEVSVALGGQLISIAAVMMCFGAPVLAALLGHWDRRRLLVLSLVWFAIGHGLSAIAPNYALLLPLRALCVVAAAVYTPQAAAAIGFVAPPEERGRSIIFIFLGWSVASVVGMPMHSYIGEEYGWRWAFGLVTLLSAGAAWWVWVVMPDGIKPPTMRLADWREVFTHPVLMAIVLVTALCGAGQFTLFAYMAPYYRQVIGANAAETSFLFFWTGAFGLLGNLLLSRYIDRIGAARIVAVSMVGMAISMLAWPLATGVISMALVILPWGLGGFASNSAQQARLGLAAPHLATALMALNSSAIYLGQAVGAAGGGIVVAAHAALGESGRDLYKSLHWIAAAWVIVALALSVWAQRQTIKLGGKV
ncbi:MFS transporter [Piscinibacter sp. HJYY11]|uniref:MFS transporter n=1 Tax=Piscinibacter sp. HJYY11 TaxID=2801333 RepID=UPI00191FB307|nr:MFS transporter [Piscinibacter sp. HJYY11]MBL0726908.1 MFS transporter [Piscinibacter sp. HJYY11]